MVQVVNLVKNLESNIPIERGFSISEAFEIFKNAIEYLNISYTLESHSNKEPITWSCSLYKDNNKISTGVGKGESTNSVIIGACYEALEHYFINRLDKLDHHSPHIIMSYNQIKKACCTTLEQFYEKNFFIQLDHNHQITWLEFINEASLAKFYMPWALFNVSYIRPIPDSSATHLDNFNAPFSLFLQ